MGKRTKSAGDVAIADERPQENPLSQFEKYEIVEMNRADIKECPFNPRAISEEAKRRLRANLKRVGLLQPLVVNGRTGRLCSGHQRIACLDTLEGHKNYKLRVAVVDLSEKEEKEQVIFFNNQEAMGVWDIDKLASIYKDGWADFEASGFDSAQAYKMFGIGTLSAKPEALEDLAEKIRVAQEHMDKVAAKSDDENSVAFFTVVIFKDDAQRQAFNKALGLDDYRFVDGRNLMRKMGMEVAE